MSRKIAAAALSGAACALALQMLPARAQDYGMLWGPQPAYPPAVVHPWGNQAPAFRPRRAERRSYFGQFGRKARPSPVARATPRKQAKDDDEGGAPSKPRASHAGNGAYRTLCVRSCDGYYWPISHATSRARFGDDEKSCKASCPNQKVALYTHRTEGEWSDDAVSLKGKAISALKNAFVYRQEYKPECTCKLPQPLVASSGATKRHAKVSAGSLVIGSERKDGNEPSADARNADADPGATGSVAPKTEPDKDAGQSNRPAEAENSTPTRRVRIIGPQFLVDR
jgi:hypothetical protein